MTATTLSPRPAPRRPAGTLSARQRSMRAPSCDAVLRDMALVLHLTSMVKQAIVRQRAA